MIQQEQKDLAEYVKQVHLSLRRKTQEIGAEKAWEEHLKNEEVLQNYSFAMKKLAEDYWSVSNKNEGDTFLCRIEWMMNCIIEYYEKESYKKEMEKELRKLKMFREKNLFDSQELNFSCDEEVDISPQRPYKLLDVGSCYHPFGKFEILDVYSIDLCPAVPEVKKLNFLETDITHTVKDNWFNGDLKQLPKNFFHVVVFSLFLEYLPSPQQRYVACKKAYDCLTTSGILLIATPDSKHASANASIMKSWKLAAAQIGFHRIYLEKLKYLYCMVFRKAIHSQYPSLLYNNKLSRHEAEEMFVIPQDSVDYKLRENNDYEKRKDEEESKNLFRQLPLLFEDVSKETRSVEENKDGDVARSCL